MVPRASELSVLDVSILAALRALAVPGEPDVLTEVARLFFVDVPIQLSALQRAIAAADLELARQVAHQLRGSALIVGAVRMTSMCQAIEQAESLEQVAAQTHSLDQEFVLVRRELEQAIQ
ncbi:MAG TPA: Hpt domain-containing protein [Vicinamibacterales bacterium]|nr:Hpt domain-containing protein [Vicinamibacterales bacterium]